VIACISSAAIIASLTSDRKVLSPAVGVSGVLRVDPQEAAKTSSSRGTVQARFSKKRWNRELLVSTQPLSRTVSTPAASAESPFLAFYHFWREYRGLEDSNRDIDIVEDRTATSISSTAMENDYAIQAIARLSTAVVQDPSMNNFGPPYLAGIRQASPNESLFRKGRHMRQYSSVMFRLGP
jgi:hypothetical protein